MRNTIKFLLVLTTVFSGLSHPSIAQHRVIISSDIGGTDDDDFQSMIHYLMYADKFKTEGLISSPYGPGRKEAIHHILDLYEKDYPKLKARSADFPTAGELRAVTKQGATDRAPLKGWSKSTEGSDWIIKCAKKPDKEPLWILVWGGIEDVVQALHDAPEIAPKLRVYWIGGPNKKWGADAYQYLVQHFPDLWMIETNSTYRGWFIKDKSEDNPMSVDDFYANFIKGRGAMGKDFINYYKGTIKMGDTPSVAYLLHGDPEDPRSPSWGGSFIPLEYSSRRVYHKPTDHNDTIPVFGLMEWVFKGPEQRGPSERAYLWAEISGQKFEGFYAGGGLYKVRFVPKQTGNWTYRITSEVKELDGHKGSFESVDPWPVKTHHDDYTGLDNWYSDEIDPDLFEGEHQGAKTIYQFQKDFMSDWAKRWEWLED